MTVVRRLARRLAMVSVVAVMFAGLVPGGAARAEGGRGTSAETELANRYAPVVVTKQQSEPCDSNGEPFRPLPIDVILGRPDVVLRAVDGSVLVSGPTAADLYAAGADTNIDLPGNSLKPGCDYEQWVAEVGAGAPTTVYAHVATDVDHPGRLALQYWLWWPYNDWNNKHESDWEMIQLDFDAGTAQEALGVQPTEVGYAQHDGAERAAWGSSKLQLDGTSPVVYAGTGSHASFFESALYLGHSAEEGFGCDDTRGPSTRQRPEVVVLSSTPTGPDDPYAWLAYRGLWGQRAPGPNDGEHGPMFESRWTEPIDWSASSWRDDAFEVPAASGIAPTTTGSPITGPVRPAP